MHVVLYNLAALAVDAAVLWRLRRARRGASLVLALAGGALALAILAVAFAELAQGTVHLALPIVGRRAPLFAWCGLLAWGIFLHGVLLLAGAAVLGRKELPRLARGSAVAAAALAVVGAHAHWVEPSWLEITRYELRSPCLTGAVRIVVLADFQTDRIGAHERRTLRAVMDQRPDLVLLPGDYVHARSYDGEDGIASELRAALRDVGFGAPLGIVAVRGNVEQDGWPRLFEGFDVTTFDERGEARLGELHVTALSLRDSFDVATRVAPVDAFHIVVGHAPNFALGDVDADLLIAGHTHGGQVRIPGFGPLITLSRVPRSWASGRTNLPGGSTLVVSRGTGMERGHAPRLRFFCRPEIVVVDLLPDP